MKRLPITYEDARDHVVRYQHRTGDEFRVFSVDRRIAEELSLEEIAKMFGVEYEPPTGRKDVRKGRSGRKIGTVPAAFDPALIKSTSFFYSPRAHDWTDRGDHWEAHYTLGPGDLEAVPGFVWDRSESHNAAHQQNETALDAEKHNETDD